MVRLQSGAGDGAGSPGSPVRTRLRAQGRRGCGRRDAGRDSVPGLRVHLQRGRPEVRPATGEPATAAGVAGSLRVGQRGAVRRTAACGRHRFAPSGPRRRSGLRAGRADFGHAERDRHLRSGRLPRGPEHRRSATGGGRRAEAARRAGGLPRSAGPHCADHRPGRPLLLRGHPATARVRLLRPAGLGLRRAGRQPDHRLRADPGGLRPLDREARPGHQRRPPAGCVHPSLEDPADRDLHRLRRQHRGPGR